MAEILDFLTRFLPVEIAIIAVIFIYLLILFKGIAEKFISLAEKQTTLAETQAHYIQDRLEVVEKYLGISDKAIDLRDKHIQELERIADQKEAKTVEIQKALDDAQERLKIAEQHNNDILREIARSSSVQPEQVDRIREVQLNLQQASFEIGKLEIEKFVHELQTRLQAIISLAENIVTGSTSAKPRDFRQQAERMLNKAEALATTVNNLGEYQQEYRYKLAKLRPIFLRAWDIYEDEARDRHIKLKIDFEKINGTDPELELSPRHIEWATNNLIHNAIKYSFTGSADRIRYVEVSGRKEQECYVIKISNYGIGMMRDEIEKGLIFQNGYQGRLTQGEYRTGSGKGLTFVKRVIDQHNGTITVESKSAGGNSESQYGQPHLNVFTISLPLKQQ